MVTALIVRLRGLHVQVPAWETVKSPLIAATRLSSLFTVI
jgi:hypothetical protein